MNLLEFIFIFLLFKIFVFRVTEIVVRQSGFRFAHFSVIVIFLLKMSYTDRTLGENGTRLGGGGRLVDLQLLKF